MTSALPQRFAISTCRRKEYGLRRDAVLAGPVVVEAGLADPADLRQFGERGDLLQRGVQRGGAAGLPYALPRPAVGVAVHDARRLVGVQRDGGVHGVVPGGGLGGPPRARQVAADLDDGRHPDGRRLGQRLVHGAGLHVEVGVRVGHRNPERLRQRRGRALVGCGRSSHAGSLRAAPGGVGPRRPRRGNAVGPRAPARGSSRAAGPAGGRGQAARSPCPVPGSVLRWKCARRSANQWCRSPPPPLPPPAAAPPASARP